MGIEVADSLRLRRPTNLAFPRERFTARKRRVSTNALIGVGLWFLLWLGYNSDNSYVQAPDFPANTTVLIHGIRAFFPALAGWIALLIIFARSKRLSPWVMGPLGLILLYAITGLVSSFTISVDSLDAAYWGFNYLAIVLVLLAIVLVDDPLEDLRVVLQFTWCMGALLTLVLLGAIPFLGAGSLVESGGASVGPRAYGVTDEIWGMPSTRNTGFARYAAITALVALGGVLRKNKLYVRVGWGIVLAASVYALILANGRTETLAFVASLAVMLSIERTKRVINFLIITGGIILLGLRGFFSRFFLYITRTGHVDTTLSGRTLTWDAGWPLIRQNPWVGLGFQADRIYLNWMHMHNAFLHVLLQSGVLGGGAILLALLVVWFFLIKYFLLKPPADKSLIPPEMPAVFLFVMASSMTESTFAYFSAAWLLSAPIVAYAVALHRHLRRIADKTYQERVWRNRMERRNLRNLQYPLDAAPSTPGGGVAE